MFKDQTSISFPTKTSHRDKVVLSLTYIQVVEQGDIEREDLSSFDRKGKTQVSEEILLVKYIFS